MIRRGMITMVSKITGSLLAPSELFAQQLGVDKVYGPGESTSRGRTKVFTTKLHTLHKNLICLNRPLFPKAVSGFGFPHKL